MDTQRLLFVSHSHQDDPFCLRLIADLRANLGDEAVWYDTSGGLHGGDQWWDRIVAEITERPYFLVVLSPSASTSKWVPQEMAMAFRQHVELGKRLLPVRLAESLRREDWRGIQEFDFTHNDDPLRYTAALSEVLHAIDKNAPQTPVVSDAPVAVTANAPDRPLSPAERLVRETHTAYAHEHWSDVLDKTEILVEQNAMTSVLWRERASATFAIGNSVGGLAVIKQALNAGVDDADTLMLYARLIAKAGDDQQAAEMLSRAYALASVDDTATRLAILEELTAALARLGRGGTRRGGTRDDEYARRIRDARRMAPDDPRWALREIQVLLRAGQNDESLEAVRALPGKMDSASSLSDWRSAVASAAMGAWGGKNWLTYRALLDAAAHAGVDPGVIARWRLDFPHFVPKVTLSDYSGYMRSLAWSRDGTRIAIIGGGGSNKGIWDAASGRLLVTLSEGRGAAVKRMFAKALDDSHTATIYSNLSWSPDGMRVAAGTSEIGKVAIVWDANSGYPLITLRGDSHSRGATTVIWSPDGARLATAGGGIQIWDASSWRPLLTLAGMEPVAWSLDGKRLAAAGSDCVQVWDALSGQLLVTLSEGRRPVAWSPDGTRLAMHVRQGYSTLGGPIVIWELASGRQLATLGRYSESATDISWTPDGTRLVGATFGRPAMWDATDGQALTSVPPGGSETVNGVQSVAWTFDGQQVAVVDKPNTEHATVQIWGKE